METDSFPETTRGENLAEMRCKPDNPHTRKWARCGWQPDLGENIVGSTDPLSFESTGDLRLHLQFFGWAATEKDMVHLVLCHWQATVRRQYIEEHWR